MRDTFVVGCGATAVKLFCDMELFRFVNAINGHARNENRSRVMSSG
jgi:hypothetical protein